MKIRLPLFFTLFTSVATAANGPNPAGDAPEVVRWQVDAFGDNRREIRDFVDQLLRPEGDPSSERVEPKEQNGDKTGGSLGR